MRLPKPAPLVLSTCLATGFLFAVPCFADDSKTAAVAEALFQDGRRLVKAGKVDEACPKFEESYRLVAKLGTLLNLAACHDKQGKTGSAWGEYTQAVTLAKKAGEAKRVEFAREQLAELDGRLSKLALEVTEPVEGMELLVDDQPLGRAAWTTPLPLDPGSHVIVARAPGHEDWTATVEIPAEPGVTAQQVPALEPSATTPGTEAQAGTPPPKPAPDSDEAGTDGQWIAGWVLGGAGVVAAGVGTYFGINTFQKQGDSDDHCVDTRCDQEGVDLRDEAMTSAHVSTTLFAVGGALVVTGVILLVTSSDGDAEKAAGASLQVTPSLGPGWYGAQAGLRF